jgi:hypothetical protein
VLADHSYDHMFHNSFNTPNNAYKNVEDDSKYFGVMNTYPGRIITFGVSLMITIGSKAIIAQTCIS